MTRWLRFSLSLASLSAMASMVAASQSATECATPALCQQLTLEALASNDYERAHDLGWRVVQTSRRGDTAAMALLARTQSLSNRGYDALVMLQRLADAGFAIEDVETSEDFRRARDFPQWTDLKPRLAGLRVIPAVAPLAATAGTPVTPAFAPAAATAGKPATPTSASSEAALGKPVADIAAAAAREYALPPHLATPTALAYDAVSARFIFAAADDDALHVLSEQSGSSVPLVTAGWSGNRQITALAIDRRRGDLWAASHGPTGAHLHRLQLISGRPLQSLTLSEPADASRYDAIALSSDGLFLLDGPAHRVIFHQFASRDIQSFVTLPSDLKVLGLAHTGAALLVSHTVGLLRIALPSRVQQTVTTVNGVDLAGLHALAWHDASLLALRGRGSDGTLLRVSLSRNQRQATALTVLGSASAAASVLFGDALYLLLQGAEGWTLRRTSVSR